jgi:hypothetical protein
MPRRYQRPLWDYLERGGRHAVAVWHRRAGKDEIALHRTCAAAHLRVGNYWHMLPEYSQARKAMWDAINPHSGRRRIDEVFPAEIRASVNQNEMKIGLKCGSIWQLVGSDNFDSLVGSPPIGIVHSEHALANPRAAGYLRPILAENQGWSLFIYTSRGYNHGFTTYETARTTEGAFAQKLTVKETDVFTPAALETERKWYLKEYGQHDGDALFRQEFHCDFSAANIGAILARYVEQAEHEGRIGKVEFDPDGAPVEVSGDIGFRDSAAWWFWQPRYDGFALLDYDEDVGLDAQEWIPRLEEKGYKIGKVWLPHDAKAKTFQWRHSVMEQFAAHFSWDRIGVVPQAAKHDRINAARTIMPLCHFHRERTAGGLDALRGWSFDYDDDRRIYSREPFHNWASHGADGFSYGCQVMRERKVPKPKVRTIPGPKPWTLDWLTEGKYEHVTPARVSRYRIE